MSPQDQTILDRLQRLEQQQEMLRGYLASHGATSDHLLEACMKGDVAVARSMIGLGLVPVNEPIKSRTLLAWVLSEPMKSGHTEIAHLLLDHGAETGDGYRGPASLLTSDMELKHPGRLDLLLRCESSLREHEHLDMQINAMLVIRAALCGRLGVLEARHLQFQHRGSFTKVESHHHASPLKGKPFDGTSFYTVWLPAINCIAMHGTARQFHEALELGLRPCAGEVTRDGGWAGGGSHRMSTQQLLELLGDNWAEHRAVLTAHQSRQVAQAAMQEACMEANGEQRPLRKSDIAPGGVA